MRTGRPRIVKAEHEAPMVEMYLSGTGCREASLYFGYDREYACRSVLIRHGISRRQQREVSESDAQGMIADYEAGLWPTEIARKHGFGLTTVNEQLRSRGVARRMPWKFYSINHSFFSTIDTEGKAWALGFISADGCVYGDRTVSVTAHPRDRDVLETLARLMEFTGPIRDNEFWGTTPGAKKKRLNRRSTLYITSRQMVSDLARYGVVPRKSLILKPWDAPPHLRAHYFRGLVDGDGSIGCRYGLGPNKDKTVWNMTLVGTESVVRAFDQFVFDHTSSRLTIRQRDTIWQSKINGARTLRRLATVMYGNATCFLARKKALADCLRQSDFHFNVDWLDYPAERLATMRSELGSWQSVANRIGCDLESLRVHRRRLGMPACPRFNGNPGWRRRAREVE